MGEVVLDGEKVDFQGNAPETVVAAWQVIEEHLGGADRVLETATINGVECSADQAAKIEVYDRIEFCSLSVSEKLLNLGTEWQESCILTVDTINSLAASVLSVSWSDSQSRTVELIENFRPFVEGFGVIEEQGRQRAASWSVVFSKSYATGVAAIEGVIQAVESQSCIKLSDQLAFDFLSSWRALLDCLRTSVLPSLKKEAANG